MNGGEDCLSFNLIKQKLSSILYQIINSLFLHYLLKWRNLHVLIHEKDIATCKCEYLVIISFTTEITSTSGKTLKYRLRITIEFRIQIKSINTSSVLFDLPKWRSSDNIKCTFQSFFRVRV